MACQTCGSSDSYSDMNKCMSCSRVDGDFSVKPVKYCSLCGGYICKECWFDFPKRAKAAIITVIDKIK